MRPKTLRWLGAFAAAVMSVAPAGASAQYRTAPSVPAYALSNVTVVQPDGSRTEGVNIVVRRGLIEAMGQGVGIPGDARVLEGDSLYVFSGLVDGHGGVKAEYPGLEEEDPILSWAPSRARQGFMPHMRAADHIVATGDDLQDARQAGIVASAVHPADGMAPGQSAVLIHRADADAAWELIADNALGLSMTFRGASGVYPMTPFGVIALIRQNLLDAQRAATIEARYRSNPEGVPTPRMDPDYEALQAVLDGSARVFFAADDAEAIRKVLRLQDEFGFQPVIVGGQGAGAVADELARRRIPVLFSVAFDSPDDWDPESGEELSPRAARERDELLPVYEGAAALHNAGVTLALTSGGIGGGLLEGARKAIEYGLPESAAMAALTTTPAALLGIPNVVRVDEGLAATFVVTDGELLGEDTGIVYTFVDGILEEGASGAGGEPPAAILTGEWDMTVGAQGMEISMELTLTQDGANLAGSLESAEMGNSTVSGGTVSGSNVTIEVSSPQLPEPLVFTGTINADGTRMSGSASSPFGELTFSARKKPGADAEGGAR